MFVFNALKIIFHKIKQYKIIESALMYLRNLVFYYKMTTGQDYDMTNKFDLNPTTLGVLGVCV